MCFSVNKSLYLCWSMIKFKCLFITSNGFPVLGLLEASFAEINSDTGFLVSLAGEWTAILWTSFNSPNFWFRETIISIFSIGFYPSIVSWGILDFYCINYFLIWSIDIFMLQKFFVIPRYFAISLGTLIIIEVLEKFFLWFHFVVCHNFFIIVWSQGSLFMKKLRQKEFFCSFSRGKNNNNIQHE